jgi:Fungal specific transcription factor domain
LNLSPSEGRSPEENRNPVPLTSRSSPVRSQQAWKHDVSLLEPGPTYIAPGSGILFGNTRDRTSILDFLPSRVAGDRLLEQYHDAVHFIARVVHWPSFQTQYDSFWKCITVGVEPPGSLQAIVFAVMFSALVSMDEHDVVALFSVSKRNRMASFQTATEIALGKANFLRTTKLETLQALVVYLIPMCRDEMSRAHSVLVGTAIRLAECMGLHRDPQETYGLGPLETHIRRILWCQLCFLDIRTTEAQGPRPLIRRDEFDSSFPLNVNDVDLISGSPKESRGWTDMTFSKIRFECNEMHRVIGVDRSRLEKKQISLTHVLGKIESFRKAMEAKYHPILDDKVPLQKEAKIVMNLLLLRMHIMVLHRYHNSVWIRIPDRLRQIILSTGTQQMEDAMRLETDPALQLWTWYCGAYQQWHTAFLLLVEVFSFPMRREADRIWHILDYVFEPDPSMTREQKARSILSALRDRSGAYREFRKIRAPVNMISRINSTSTPQVTDHGGARLPLNFNSDPTPPASRSVHGPPMIHHPSFGLAEYPNMISGENNILGPTSSNHSHHNQIHIQSQFDSSYAVRPSNVDAPPMTGILGRMTKAIADAPSPVSPPNPLRDHSWTFDAPSTFFTPRSHTDKPYNSHLPGEQTSQSTLTPRAATGGPNNYPNPTVGVIIDQSSRPDIWNGGVVGGDVGYPVPPPPGVGMARTPPGLLSPTSSGGGTMQSKAVTPPVSSQVTGVPVTEPDEMMVDIDWVSLLTMSHLPCAGFPIHISLSVR